MKKSLTVAVAILLAFMLFSCAEPEAPKFTVSFEGIAEKIDPVIVKAGEKFTLPEKLPTKTEHKLVIKMGDTILVPGTEYEIKADTVLKCSWVKTVYTVSFDGIEEKIASATVKAGEKFKLPENLPTKPGNKLVIKMGDSVLVADQEYAITKDTVLKCSWEKTAYIVSYTGDVMRDVVLVDLGKSFIIPDDFDIPVGKTLILTIDGKRVYRGSEIPVTGDTVINAEQLMTVEPECLPVDDKGCLIGYTGPEETGLRIAIPDYGMGPDRRPVKVTAIAPQAFDACTFISEVVLPDGIKKIGDFAFESIAINSIDLSQGLEEIGMGAFDSCGNLNEIRIPSSVSKMGAGVFSNCINLKKIIVDRKGTECVAPDWNNAWKGSDVPAIYVDTLVIRFEGTKPDGQDINIPDKYVLKGESFEIPCILDHRTDKVTIGEKAFNVNSTYENVTENLVVKYATEDIIPMSQGLVNDGSFRITGYTGNDDDLVIPNAMTGAKKVVISAIGVEAFKNNTSMKSVKIPNTISNIGHSAFLGCTKLESVEIPEFIDGLKPFMFKGCTELKSIKLDCDNFDVISGEVFSGCTNLTDITTRLTKEAWSTKFNAGNWRKDLSDHEVKVHCKDGVLVYPATTTTP